MDENLDENAIRELEEVLHTKIYPGTELMQDVGTHHFVKGNNRSVLVPQPSDDPRDPLNWSPFWKGATIFCATAVSFSQNLGPLALAPMFGNYIQLYNRSLADVVQFTGVAILVLGFSNFIWVPMSTCFGRRPVAIFSMTIYIIFLHDRVESFWWFNTGMLLFTLVICILLFPETRYHRAWESGDAPKPPPVIDPKATVDKVEGSLHEKHSGTDQEEALGTPVAHAATQHSTAAGDKIAPTETHIDPVLGQGGPGKKQFLPFQPYHGNLFRELWLPFYLHLFPIVEFAAFVVSWSASGFLVVNLSQSQAFAAPPYNFSSQTIGLFNLAVLVGGGVGLFTCGPLSDWVAAYLTRRNNGIREPEMRLVAMVPYIIIMVIGSIVTSVGYDYHWKWEVIVIIGYSFLGCQVAALPSIASTYAIDSYKPVTGSLFVTITM
ncbi:hypothetical protein SLS64_000824 [Diaporthe eres]|uniref:Uncharacterized protein n=1 Tax=Diaporthe eres TaxID=83184 RepID=A0ABR1P495_DIAER